VLLADLKGSMELLADRDPEEARRLLDPVLEHMMEAVHHYEGTVNQVMGDGIMALFGAPLAHEDHAVRACYAALRMQERVGRYADEIQRSHGVPVQIRVGLNSGDVVVRSIGSDLHMDYTAVGQTTHLAARMEQMAKPGSSLLTPATLRLVEGYVRVRSLGPVPVRGLVEPVEVFELLAARRGGRGYRCRPPVDSRASSAARPRWTSSEWPSSALAPVAGRSSRSSGSPASASRVWRSSSSTRIGRKTGSSSSRAPCPTARRPRSCRSSS
jgi:class 3 adenylate cyclase